MRLEDWRRRLGGKKPQVRPRMEQSEYRSYRAVHPFDERFGVETSGLIYSLPTGHAHDPCNNGYFAVAPSIFRQIMERMERLELDYPRFRFVDVGSGKGRALLLASDYPFREVIGVELSPELDRIARTNIARYCHGGPNKIAHRPEAAAPGAPRARSETRSVQTDAAEFHWPAGPLLVYMWNAFTGPVMERVLQNLKAALGEQHREIYLVYVHPELEEMLDHLPWLERLWSVEFTMSEEDYSAWAFPERTEICAVYRAT
jgi:SAM-dependent methyltransferase